MACEHRGCKCREATIDEAGGKYCSAFCATAQTTGQHDARCACGHPECLRSAGGQAFH